MKYFLIAGEHSGDMYGAAVINALKQKDKEAVFVGVGGDKMEKAGMALVTHIRDLAVMGLWQVILKFFTIKKKFDLCKTLLVYEKPNVVILIDYSGFNLRIAKIAKQLGLKVVYYIPPKVWAWGEKRILKIKQYVDKVLLIFPFEKKIYDQYGISNVYVGNPLIEILQNKTSIDLPIQNKRIIAIMPGSREQEVKKMLPIMLKVAKYFPTYAFVVIKAANLSDELYDAIIKKRKKKYTNIFSVRNLENTVIKKSELAIVKSGTSTLHVALLKTPQVVCYKTNWLNYIVMKSVLKSKYISLPNLIMDKEIVTELLQSRMTPYRIKVELEKISIAGKDDFKYKKTMLGQYRLMEAILDTSKMASLNVAIEIVKLLKAKY